MLEITESVLLPGDDVILDRLNALAALGIHLYIDDFGTGYSSLSYLQALPVNGLKLAQEFVESLPGTETESGLVRTIRDLADTLGLSTVVAEGIERPEQWDSLLALGYHVGQGFHLAVPMPADRVPEFLSGVVKARATASWGRPAVPDGAGAPLQSGARPASRCDLGQPRSAPGASVGAIAAVRQSSSSSGGRSGGSGGSSNG